MVNGIGAIKEGDSVSDYTVKHSLAEPVIAHVAIPVALVVAFVGIRSWRQGSLKRATKKAAEARRSAWGQVKLLPKI